MQCCPDCLEPFEEARLLPCMHMVCPQAVHDAMAIGTERGVPAACPVCHEAIGVEELPRVPFFEEEKEAETDVPEKF